MPASTRITDFFRKRLIDDSQDVPKHEKPAVSKDDEIVAKRTKQTYLDLGQSPFKTCPVCNMCYDPSFPDDLKKHRKHYSKVLKEFPNGTILIPTGIPLDRCSRVVGYQMIMVTSDSAARAMLSLVEKINDHLMSAAALDFDQRQYKIYLAVDDASMVAGMVLAESQPEAFPSKDLCEIDRSQEPVKVILGISRIWVAPRRRKQGLASAMLDFVRETFAKPVKISKRMVAFSQPTSDGFALAMAYSHPNPCLVYL